VPIFGTLIALLEDDEPLVGVIHFPMTGETIYAGKGLGCWFKGGDAAAVQVHVASKVGLKEAVVSAAGIHSSNIRFDRGERPYNLTGLIHQVEKFRFCGDCPLYQGSGRDCDNAFGRTQRGCFWRKPAYIV
jgi:histidinol-phosphatase